MGEPLENVVMRRSRDSNRRRFWLDEMERGARRDEHPASPLDCRRPDGHKDGYPESPNGVARDERIEQPVWHFGAGEFRVAGEGDRVRLGKNPNFRRETPRVKSAETVF